MTKVEPLRGEARRGALPMGPANKPVDRDASAHQIRLCYCEFDGD